MKVGPFRFFGSCVFRERIGEGEEETEEHKDISKLRVALPWKNYFDKFPRLFGVVLFFLRPLMVNNFVAVLPFAIGEVEKAFSFVYDGLIEGQPRSKE